MMQPGPEAPPFHVQEAHMSGPLPIPYKMLQHPSLDLRCARERAGRLLVPLDVRLACAHASRPPQAMPPPHLVNPWVAPTASQGRLETTLGLAKGIVSLPSTQKGAQNTNQPQGGVLGTVRLFIIVPS